MVRNSIKEYTADSYDDFIAIISELEKDIAYRYELPKFSPLWYRGHEYSKYDLLPSLLREQKTLMSEKDGYSIEHMQEDYRFQIFKSRAYDHLSVTPESRIEWQEVMQHHFTKTRLMDWSEKSISPLTFSLQPFLTPKSDLTNEYSRSNLEPAIWIMSPYILNKLVYNTFLTSTYDMIGVTNKNEEDYSSEDINVSKKRYYYIERALRDLVCKTDNVIADISNETDEIYEKNNELIKIATLIGNELKAHGDKYFSEQYSGENMKKISPTGIVGLSVIESYRNQNSSRLLEMLKNMEFNPFFYLAIRYYVDGVSAPLHPLYQLPPLATVHPYHSNRIKAQAGAFSVFPYYFIDDKFYDRKKYLVEKSVGHDIRCMNNQPSILSSLAKIRLINPPKIAKQLLIGGHRISGVYPEIQNYSHDIEATNYFV